MSAWIKLSKRMPPAGAVVKVAISTGETRRAFWTGEFWTVQDAGRNGVILRWFAGANP